MPFERISIKDEVELEDIVIQELAEVEEGLSVLDRVLTDTGRIILCHDREGRFVIVESRLFPDDRALFDGLKYLDQYHVLSMLKLEDTRGKLQLDAKPRLILLAPSFSDDVIRIVRYIGSEQIRLFEWEYLKLGDQQGLYVKPVSLQINEEQRLWSKLKERLLLYRQKVTPLMSKGT